MGILLLFFSGLAVIGLLLSLVSHLCGLCGFQQPLGEATWSLHLGIFVVWLPAVLAACPLGKDFKQKDLWKAVLRGCPRWMRWLAYGFLGYALVNFAIFFATTLGQALAGAFPGDDAIGAGFSGHWMAFYAMAAAILYSAYVVRQHDPSRRCPNKHPVSPSALFCEVCGASVGEAQYSGAGENNEVG